MAELEFYDGAYTGQQIDDAVGKVENADATPTLNSQNMVTSGGVDAAFSQLGLIQGGLWDAQLIPPGSTPDLNNVSTNGFLACGSSTLNMPIGSGAGKYGVVLTVVYLSSPLRAFQIFYAFDTGVGLYFRGCIGGTWGAWKTITTT